MCEDVVPVLHTCGFGYKIFTCQDDLIPFFHKCDDLVSILHTREDLVPIRIVSVLHTLKKLNVMKLSRRERESHGGALTPEASALTT